MGIVFFKNEMFSSWMEDEHLTKISVWYCALVRRICKSRDEKLGNLALFLIMLHGSLQSLLHVTPQFPEQRWHMLSHVSWKHPIGLCLALGHFELCGLGSSRLKQERAFRQWQLTLLSIRKIGLSLCNGAMKDCGTRGTFWYVSWHYHKPDWDWTQATIQLDQQEFGASRDEC